MKSIVYGLLVTVFVIFSFYGIIDFSKGQDNDLKDRCIAAFILPVITVIIFCFFPSSGSLYILQIIESRSSLEISLYTFFVYVFFMELLRFSDRPHIISVILVLFSSSTTSLVVFEYFYSTFEVVRDMIIGAIFGTFSELIFRGTAREP